MKQENKEEAKKVPFSTLIESDLRKDIKRLCIINEWKYDDFLNEAYKALNKKSS